MVVVLVAIATSCNCAKDLGDARRGMAAWRSTREKFLVLIDIHKLISR